MNRSDIDETVRDLWATRPARRKDGRKIAGVAAALGRRYRIDPTLVRVALVVATVFGGVGVLVYLIGWLTLPEDDGQSSAVEALFGHGVSSMSKPLTVVLLLALIPAMSAVVGGGGLSGLFAAGIAAAAIFLTHKHRAALGEPGMRPVDPAPGMPGAVGVPGLGVPGTYPGDPLFPAAGPHAQTAEPYAMSIAGPYRPHVTAAPGATAGPGAATADPSAPGAKPAFATGTNPAFATGAAATGYTPPATAPPGTGAVGHPAPGSPHGFPAPGSPGDQPTTPPAWDPLGVAPFAWDLPEPTPTTPPEEDRRSRAPKRRSAVTPVTLGLTLVTTGAASMVATASDAVGAREVAAVALATVGLGLLVGSLTRGGRGLIGVVIPLALVTFVLSMMPSGTIGADGGQRTWTPTTIADVQPEYVQSGGNMTLDLRELDIADGDRVETALRLGGGNLTVLLPADADVEARCEAGGGQVDCLGETTNGFREGSRAVTDLGADGAGGGTIVVEAEIGGGNVEVRRG